MIQDFIQKIRSKLRAFFHAPLARQERVELADLRQQKRRFMPRTKINSSGPGIFLVTIPKSATSYIANCLAQSLKYDLCSRMCVSSFRYNFLSPERMKDFEKGGMVAVSHMRPTASNLEIFKFFGGKKIVIHVRDPRATMVSWLHFVEKTMQTAKEDNDLERQTRLRRAAFAKEKDYFSLTQDQKIKALTESFYQHCIDRIISWLEVKDPEIERLFLTYEDFLKDQDGYFKRLTEFYGIDTKIAGPPKTTNPHFRQGTKDGWRKELNEEQIRKLNERMPDLLWKRFGWERD